MAKGNPKYLFIAVLALAAIGIAALFIWKLSSSGPQQTGSAKINPLSDCDAVEYPFACHLDKAMQSKNPVLCGAAGLDKRANCLRAYAEITGTEVDCGSLGDLQFRIECEAAFRPEEGTVEEAASSASLPQGLRVDQP